MTAVKERATSMIQTLSDESVVYVVQILEGLQGLERQKTPPVSNETLERRVADLRQGIHCAEHELVEAV